MLVYGCGVSMYPQFFVEDLKTYQMLTRPYIRSFVTTSESRDFQGIFVVKLRAQKTDSHFFIHNYL